MSDFGDFESLVQTIHRLRAPGGCPWDRAQTHHTLRPYVIEEAYEVLDALDRADSPQSLKRDDVRMPLIEELGDLWLQILLHSEIAAETGAFTWRDVARGLKEKMIRRHPHVFGDATAASADEALAQWEKNKAAEKAAKAASGETSVLDGLPKGMPALQRAARVIEKVTKVGFQWPDLQGPLSKLDEELGEFKDEVAALEKDPKNDSLRARVSAELGDLLFSLANVAHFLKLQPEDSLRSNLQRFEKRFRHLERRMAAEGFTPESSSLGQMDVYWNEAKAREKCLIWGLTGGIASGKSTAANHLRDRQVPVIDADAIVRKLSAPGGAAHSKIQAAFGATDRKELGALIFNDPQKRKTLESILHPLVRAESDREIARILTTHPGTQLIVYEAALLIEAGRAGDFDGVLLITAPEDARVARVVNRDGGDVGAAQARISAQLPDVEKRMHAHHVIENTGTLELLKKQVDLWLAEVLRRP